MLVDETGCTSSGRLVLSDHAWTTLLGRAPETIALLACDDLRDIEQSILFTRLVLLFGWAAEDHENGVGRICVADINAYK
jgi:hypothetical protein